jgi:hypothetical protein
VISATRNRPEAEFLNVMLNALRVQETQSKLFATDAWHRRQPQIECAIQQSESTTRILRCETDDRVQVRSNPKGPDHALAQLGGHLRRVVQYPVNAKTHPPTAAKGLKVHIRGPSLAGILHNRADMKLG